MSEPVPIANGDTLLESYRIRERELELEAVQIKARLEELRLMIAMYMAKPRGGRRGPKPVAVLNEQLAVRLVPFGDPAPASGGSGGDDPPESAA